MSIGRVDIGISNQFIVAAPHVSSGNQKGMAVAFVAFICALFIVCAGCTSIKKGYWF
jgi:hypothetical protein